ncbi:MAG: DUF1853 family protein [Nonlabens sp.]
MQDSFERLRSFYSTPSLWTGELLSMKQFSLNQLNFSYSDQQKSEIHLPDIPYGTVLGKRAEYYFKFCVEQSTIYRCLISNLQIFKGKTTVGELDFIVEDCNSNKMYHVELVYKFYIYDPEIAYVKKDDSDFELKNELARYVGPNRRDHLLKKLYRLKRHQLPLLYRSETIEVLEKQGVEVNKLQQRVCFLAQVFIPQRLWDHDFPYLNRKCIVGYYVRVSAFAKARTEHSYYLPHKHQWKMQPFMEVGKAYKHNEILTEVLSSLDRKYAPLLWMSSENGWERFFVIAD